MSSNTLRIQELLALCITSVSDSPRTLLNCSLVARSWVNAAQSELFRIAYLSGRPDRVARKFYNALLCSPHLAHYVRELSIGDLPSLIQNFVHIPFTHLHTLRLAIYHVSVAFEIYRPLLSLPTLRTLHLQTFSGLSASVRFLALCPTIQHLHLSCGEDYEESPPNSPSVLSMTPSVIRLISLQLEILAGELDAPQHDLGQAAWYPIDLSGLKALSIWGSNLIIGDILPKATQENIRILDSNSWVGELDLSPFKNLRVLRLGMVECAESDVRRTLASISSSNLIQTVVLGLSNGLLHYNKDECAHVDRILLSLASRDIRVEFEFQLNARGAEEKVQEWFPAITSQNKLEQFHLVYLPYGATDIWRRDLLPSL
ncbi:hypothetical protein R3P38DRAFT_1707923 [Favolaschia claudopus]|uniref:F-box domain-containing protein n=1 Tax=Favolaschia claudopus TaxID=2862362 RepID=A0AAW0AB06_9AGAR